MDSGCGLHRHPLTLTIIAAQQSAGSSVLDRMGDRPAPVEDSAPGLPGSDSLLPPSADDSAPLTPTAD